MGRMKQPHEHGSGAGAPGASGPNDPAYGGEATIGDEGAAAGPEAFVDPSGRPDQLRELGPDAVPAHVREAWARAEAKDR